MTEPDVDVWRPVFGYESNRAVWRALRRKMTLPDHAICPGGNVTRIDHFEGRRTRQIPHNLWANCSQESKLAGRKGLSSRSPCCLLSMGSFFKGPMAVRVQVVATCPFPI